ncbi:hypothetical protein F2P81_023045 [Scophthalmus maximus]|uniref:Uncharacterized protein n=1 Tax=Scophthalmus maximus TaxID=52904 RepID=A0A6A4RQH1_SCOMX|nr:hypothetical protein F2P81_023045 [Scophthalmus maximus]
MMYIQHDLVEVLWLALEEDGRQQIRPMMGNTLVLGSTPTEIARASASLGGAEPTLFVIVVTSTETTTTAAAQRRKDPDFKPVGPNRILKSQGVRAKPISQCRRRCRPPAPSPPNILHYGCRVIRRAPVQLGRLRVCD